MQIHSKLHSKLQETVDDLNNQRNTRTFSFKLWSNLRSSLWNLYEILNYRLIVPKERITAVADVFERLRNWDN